MRVQQRPLKRTLPFLTLSLCLLGPLFLVNPMASQEPDRSESKWRTGYIPMKDGVKLAYVLHRPQKSGQFPVLLTYNGELGGATTTGPEEMQYLAHGYAVLGVSVRGTGASEGVFTSPFAAQEAEDGKAIVEWAGEQSWCDGNVGMYGNYYAGVSQLEVASGRPKRLKALAAGGVWGDSYEDLYYPGGIFNIGLVGQWSYETQPYLSATSARLREFVGDLEGAKRRAANPSVGATFAEMRAHPFQDDWWAVRAFENLAPQIETPTLIFQGWHDSQVSARGALRVFERLRAPKRILLSNGGDNLLTQASLIALRLRWFDRWLKGKQNGVDKEPSVTIWFETRDQKRRAKTPSENVSGTLKHSQGVDTAPQQATPARTNLSSAWATTFSTWPIPEGNWSTLYLTADGRLDKAKPVTQRTTGPRFYLYPAATELIFTNELFSVSPASVGSLVYRTVPLPEDMAIIGSPVLTLYASSEQKDTDFMADLHDVNPRGEITYVQRGLVRASHRALDAKKSAPHEPVHAHGKVDELVPGQVYEIKFALLPVGHLVRRGHSLELAIMAPPSLPSLSWGFAPVTPPGLNTIYHSAKYPSNLELPVVPGVNAQAPAPPFGSLPLQPARKPPVEGWDNQRKNLDEMFRSWKREKVSPG
jgi:predicted acyl esterase